jgi:hypothetical protein
VHKEKKASGIRNIGASHSRKEERKGEKINLHISLSLHKQMHV